MSLFTSSVMFLNPWGESVISNFQSLARIRERLSIVWYQVLFYSLSAHSRVAGFLIYKRALAEASFNLY
jgi:hypothetical protein